MGIVVDDLKVAGVRVIAEKFLAQHNIYSNYNDENYNPNDHKGKKGPVPGCMAFFPWVLVGVHNNDGISEPVYDSEVEESHNVDIVRDLSHFWTQFLGHCYYDHDAPRQRVEEDDGDVEVYAPVTEPSDFDDQGDSVPNLS